MAVCAGEAGARREEVSGPLLGKDGALRWVLYFALPDVGEQAKSMDLLSGITRPLR